MNYLTLNNQIPNIDIDILHHRIVSNKNYNNLIKKTWFLFINNLYNYERSYNTYIMANNEIGRLLFLKKNLNIIKEFNNTIKQSCLANDIIVKKLITMYQNKINKSIKI